VYAIKVVLQLSFSAFCLIPQSFVKKLVAPAVSSVPGIGERVRPSAAPPRVLKRAAVAAGVPQAALWKFSVQKTKLLAIESFGLSKGTRDRTQA
jgi:hypothetical protein